MRLPHYPEGKNSFKALRSRRFHNAFGMAILQYHIRLEAVSYCTNRTRFCADLTDKPMVQDEILKVSAPLEAAFRPVLDAWQTFGAHYADPRADSSRLGLRHFYAAVP